MKKIFFIVIGVVVILIGFYRYQNYYQSRSKGTGNLELVALDIGQGDATLIRFPNGEKMLVDCSKDARILEALGRHLAFGDTTIDYLVATHPDLDHYGGCIDVLERYRVKHIYFNGFVKEGSQLLEAFMQGIHSEEGEGAEYALVSTTLGLTVADATVKFLYPDHSIEHDPRVPGVAKIDSNDTSIVMKITYGEESVLLTGDMEIPLEQYLVKKYGAELDSDVLKVGHHGSKSSSGQEFLAAVTPDYAMISAGKGNSYGHPAPRVLKRLERVHSQILRTDEFGDILLRFTTTSLNVNHHLTH